MTVVADDFSPIYINDVGAPFTPQFLHKDGSAVNLTGATITMKMQDSEGNTKTCTGMWVIDNTTNGNTHYLYSTNDVNTAGNWTLYITITINNASVHADTKLLEILPAP